MVLRLICCTAAFERNFVSLASINGHQPNARECRWRLGGGSVRVFRITCSARNQQSIATVACAYMCLQNMREVGRGRINKVMNGRRVRHKKKDVGSFAKGSRPLISHCVFHVRKMSVNGRASQLAEQGCGRRACAGGGGVERRGNSVPVWSRLIRRRTQHSRPPKQATKSRRKAD